MLTKRRTACASGLASRYLSRPDSRRLLMIGTGALAPQLIRVHAKVRPIAEVAIWGRRPEAGGSDLPTNCRSRCRRRWGAPITVRAVSRSATGRGAGRHRLLCHAVARRRWSKATWLAAGQHIDLVGAYTPEMRESDDRAVARARVYVDTRAGAIKEGGDIVQPMANGTIGGPT